MISKTIIYKYKVENGFTLIEILVSTGILIILGAGLLGLQYIISQNQITAWTSFSSIESANNAVSQIGRELRNATESDNGAYPLDTLLDNEIIFYSDYDFDGDVERIRYTRSGTDLFRGIVEPSGNPATYNVGNELVRNISDIVRNDTDVVFTYYNKDYPTDTINNPLVQSSRISDTRYVKIFLRTNSRQNDEVSDYVLQSEVKIRMLENVN